MSNVQAKLQWNLSKLIKAVQSYKEKRLRQSNRPTQVFT